MARTLYIIAILLLVPGRGRAETRKISIFEAIDIALHTNLDLRQATQRVATSAVAVEQSRSGYYPDASASVRSTLGYRGAPETAMSGTAGGTSTTTAVGLNSTLNLFRGFQDRYAVAESELQLRADELDLTRARQSIVYDAISRFIQAVVDQELIRVDVENLAAQRAQLELVLAYHQHGRRPIADVYQQQAEVARAELNLLNSKTSLETSKLLLLQTLGLDPESAIEIVPLDIETLVARVKNAASSQATDDDRPDWLAQQQRIAAAKKGIEKAHAGIWPSLALSFDLGTDYTATSGQSAGVGDQLFDNNLVASIGLALSIPLFDRFVTRHATEQARLQLTLQEIQAANIQHQMTIDLRQAIENFTTAIKQVDVASSQRQFTGQSLAAYEERYKVNASTLVEVSQARSRHLEATYEEVKAKYNLVVRGIAVEYHKGHYEGMISLLGQ